MHATQPTPTPTSLTSAQVAALSDAAVRFLDDNTVPGWPHEDRTWHVERWVSNFIDWPFVTAAHQTELAIAVTTLINAD